MAAVQSISKKKLFSFFLAIIMFMLIFISRPFGLSSNQSLLFGAVVMTIVFWATSCIKRLYACIFLLLFAVCFSGISPLKIFAFPLSSNFYLILASFLLSECINKSNLTSRIANSLLRFCKKPIHFLMTAFLLNIILLFLMPQPFPRVIILSAVFTKYLQDRQFPFATIQVIIFAVFIATMPCSMIILNGDIILNYAALSFSSISVSWIQWALYMAVPSFVTAVLMCALFLLVFKREIFLSSASYNVIESPSQKTPFTRDELLSGIILSLVIASWVTESLHGISPTVTALVGVAFMFCLRLLSFSDLKSINVEIMFFMTAAFSIGAILVGNGTGMKILDVISHFITTDYLGANGYNLLAVALLMIVFHLLLGSVTATLSIILPCILLPGTPFPVAFSVGMTAYIAGTLYALLPFHHATLIFGLGLKPGYAPSKVTRYGLAMTFLIFPVIAGIYIPWWRFTGLF